MTKPAATAGPFVVELIKCQRMLMHRIYHVRVVGADGKHFVRRQFRDFAELRESSVRVAELPEMPYRTCSRKRRRMDRLEDIVAAVVRRDPYAVMPELRRFLGLGAVSSWLVVSPLELRQVLRLSDVERFGSLAEGDEKEEHIAGPHAEYSAPLPAIVFHCALA